MILSALEGRGHWTKQPFFLSANYPDAHRPFLRQFDGIPERPLRAADFEILEYKVLDSPELRDKRTSYETGVRVPLIVRWSGLQQAGQVREELASTLDLMPTFLEASSGGEVTGLAGRSLSPLVTTTSPQRIVRARRHKLICNLAPNTVNPGHAYALGRFFSEAEQHQTTSRDPQGVRVGYQARADCRSTSRAI